MQKVLPRRRLLLFRLIALSLPFVALLVLEGILRLTGYGHDLSLFMPSGTDYLVMNPHASERYFRNQQNATTGNQEPFLRKKPEGTFRIFVLGESTTIGYPYFHNGSFHRWLQYRLMRSAPDTPFEVINVSLTAVNSYTMLGFAREVAEQEPDAVLVYGGHNEYYGALGVGSAFFRNPALNRFVLRLRDFRVVQLIENTASQLTSRPADLRENLMKRMAEGQQIPYDSEAYHDGIRQFEANMTAMCRLFSEKKIPVFLSTLVSNEKDLKPFVSDPGPDGADAHFAAGTRAWQAGHFAVAAKEFRLARERDKLRFRAPEAMNGIVRRLVRDIPGVTLVDAEARFREVSPHGILGEETLLEHVHPNLYGYALLSDAFYEGIKNRVHPTRILSFAELRQAMPITPVDSLKGAYEILILKEGWPFNSPMPPEEKRPKTMEEELAGGLVVRQITWSDALNRLEAGYLKAQNLRGARQVAEALALDSPLETTYAVQAGKLSLALEDTETGLFYLRKAFHQENSLETAQPLFVTLLKLDRPEEALPYLNYAAAGNPTLAELQSYVTPLISLKKQLATDSLNVHLLDSIAQLYLRFANTTAAEKYQAKARRFRGK